MFSSLLVSVAVTSALADLPPVSHPELQAQDIQFVARVTPTRFAAINPSHSPLLLVFAGDQRASRTSFVLPGRGEIEFRFTSGAIDALELEVVSIVDRARVSSGSIELGRVAEPEVDALWIREDGGKAHVFTQHGTAFRTLAPARRIADDGELSTEEVVAPPQVPVITSARSPMGDKPPKMDKSLPPF